MIKSLFIAVWCCLVMLGASFAANYVAKMKSTKPGEAALAAAFETRKSRELSVPIIRDGAVKGYVVVQLNYIVDLEAAKKLQAPPEAYVVDETFQYIYGDDKIDFAHLDKLDLGKMTEALIQRVNTRLRSNVITDMGVIECNFLINSEGTPKGKT
ncbi:MAG: hypothetical protein KGM15_07285 [Pseudomonadota bacterium]|nr:hypothetical protein [Pseudomonadota bacterium]